MLPLNLHRPDESNLRDPVEPADDVDRDGGEDQLGHLPVGLPLALAPLLAPGPHAPQLDDHQHVEDQDATQRPHEPEHQALEGEGSLVVKNALPLLLCRGAGRIALSNACELPLKLSDRKA